MDKYMQWGINKHIRILFAELSGKQAYAFRGVAMPLYAFLLFLSTFLCAHPCCTPARPRAENNPIWVHYACIAIAILLPLALFFVRIPTVFQHGLRALLLCSSTQCCTQCSQCCALLRRNVCTQCWNAVGIRTNTLHFYFALALFVCLLRNYTFYWICCISASKPAIQHSWGSMKETR